MSHIFLALFLHIIPDHTTHSAAAFLKAFSPQNCSLLFFISSMSLLSFIIFFTFDAQVLYFCPFWSPVDLFLRQDKETTMKNKQELRGSQSLSFFERKNERERESTDLVEIDGMQQEMIIKQYKRAVTFSPFREREKQAIAQELFLHVYKNSVTECQGLTHSGKQHQRGVSQVGLQILNIRWDGNMSSLVFI